MGGKRQRGIERDSEREEERERDREGEMKRRREVGGEGRMRERGEEERDRGRGREYSGVSSYKDTNHQIRAPPLQPPFTLITSLQAYLQIPSH